jgi:hypothetical protein
MAVTCVLEEDSVSEVEQKVENYGMELYNLRQKETYKDVKINPELESGQIKELENLVKKYQDIIIF